MFGWLFHHPWLIDEKSRGETKKYNKKSKKHTVSTACWTWRNRKKATSSLFCKSFWHEKWHVAGTFFERRETYASKNPVRNLGKSTIWRTDFWIVNLVIFCGIYPVNKIVPAIFLEWWALQLVSLMVSSTRDPFQNILKCPLCWNYLTHNWEIGQVIFAKSIVSRFQLCLIL